VGVENEGSSQGQAPKVAGKSVHGCAAPSSLYSGAAPPSCDWGCFLPAGIMTMPPSRYRQASAHGHRPPASPLPLSSPGIVLHLTAFATPPPYPTRSPTLFPSPCAQVKRSYEGQLAEARERLAAEASEKAQVRKEGKGALPGLFLWNSAPLPILSPHSDAPPADPHPHSAPTRRPPALREALL
jgi:hypothetical protein